MCIWDIISGLALIATIVFFVMQQQKHKKRIQELNGHQ